MRALKCRMWAQWLVCPRRLCATVVQRRGVSFQLFHRCVKPSEVDVEVAARRGQVSVPEDLLTNVTGTPASSKRDPAS